jgi:hypothetical protein
VAERRWGGGGGESREPRDNRPSNRMDLHSITAKRRQNEQVVTSGSLASSSRRKSRANPTLVRMNNSSNNEAGKAARSQRHRTKVFP